MSESYQQLRARGGWAEDAAAPAGRFPVGPWNTWSNVMYALVGTLLAARYQDDASAALAVALWVLATGSALYHGYKTIWANRLDWVGMCAVFGALAAHGWAPGLWWSGYAMLAAGALVGCYYRFQRWVSADWWMIALGVVASIPARDHLGPLAIAWGCMAAAYGIWHLDKAHHPIVGRYGHALWHVLTAFGIGYLFVAQR